MEVQVFHKDGSDFELMATVTVPNYQMNFAKDSAKDALEYAWIATQNIWGSWSRGPLFDDGEVNQDFNNNVTVYKPLQTHDGCEYGHRSSMMGDRFIVDDVSYIVAMCGFEKE